MQKTKLDRYRDEARFKELCQKSDYSRLMLLYGHDTLLLLLGEYEQAQKFEECVKIKKAIELHNELVNDKLLTK
jgi:hypothetical protein